MMLGGANTLLLDEPTNHMDIESKEVFEDALAEFPGTAIIVSHDRYFLQKIPDRILELTPEGVTEYLGRYDYYMEKKEQIESGKSILRLWETAQTVKILRNRAYSHLPPRSSAGSTRKRGRTAAQDSAPGKSRK